MAAVYTKKEVIDGKVILTRTVTSDIPKEEALNRLTEEESDIQDDIVRLQNELIKIQITIASINKITASSVVIP